MGDKHRLFRLRVHRRDLNESRSEQFPLALAQHPSETAERVLLRFLAYGIWFERDLRFRSGVCHGQAPDVGAEGAVGPWRHWVDVGCPDPMRVQRAARQAEQVTVLGPEGLDLWWRRHGHLVSVLDNVEVVRLHPGPQEQIFASLEKGGDWSLTLLEDWIYLDHRDLHWTMELIRLN